MESVKHSLEIRRCVGYVAERPMLYDWMTVDEIGWFTAGFYGGNFLPTYKGLIEQFSLPSNKKLKTLSKGMRAKVALALSMGHDPDLLILDEPTSGLDTMVRREFLESMVDRAASGKTVFLSSHQIHEVERVADIVGIMRQGKLIVVERLEKLKAEVQEVTITLADAGAVPPLVAGECFCSAPGSTMAVAREERTGRIASTTARTLSGRKHRCSNSQPRRDLCCLHAQRWRCCCVRRDRTAGVKRRQLQDKTQ